MPTRDDESPGANLRVSRNIWVRTEPHPPGTGTNPKLEIKETGKYGKGVFATKTIEKGEWIHTMKGVRMSLDEFIEKMASGQEREDDPLQIGRKTYTTWTIFPAVSTTAATRMPGSERRAKCSRSEESRPAKRWFTITHPPSPPRSGRCVANAARKNAGKAWETFYLCLHTSLQHTRKAARCSATCGHCCKRSKEAFTGFQPMNSRRLQS